MDQAPNAGRKGLTAAAKRRKASRILFRIMHTVAYGSATRAGKHKKQPRRSTRVSMDQFRTARRFSGLSREEAAELCGVSVRTIGHWETGRARPAFAAFKLLRVYRHGDLIDPRWAGFSIVRGKLVTPENHTFEPHDLAWMSLLVRRARAMTELLRQRDGEGRGCPAQAGHPNRSRAAAGDRPAPLPLDLVATHTPASAAGASLGLVSYSTTHTPISASLEKQGFLHGAITCNGATMGPRWPHDGKAQPSAASGFESAAPDVRGQRGHLAQHGVPSGNPQLFAVRDEADRSVRQGSAINNVNAGSSTSDTAACEEEGSADGGEPVVPSTWSERDVPLYEWPQGKTLPPGMVLTAGGAR